MGQRFFTSRPLKLSLRCTWNWTASELVFPETSRSKLTKISLMFNPLQFSPGTIAKHTYGLQTLSCGQRIQNAPRFPPQNAGSYLP
jgi:hypothetical protein